MGNFNFKGKRILITQPLIHPINGSTTVTLELAEYLQSQGAKVTVFTPTFADPAKAIFDKKKIRVDVAWCAPEYNIEDFDYIWVHSQIIPEIIIDQLTKKHKKLPTFIFLHMSSFDWIPDEHPFIYELEEKLSSLTLYICEEVRKSNLSCFEKEPVFGFYRNPAAMEYCIDKKPRKTLHNILMISNYPPPELAEAKEKLQKEGLNVETMGEIGDKYEFMNSQTLSKYDAVVTIAKTSQYCLVAGIPVYVYGKFGGAGWLTPKNYERAKETNFCGSDGFKNKTSDQIVKEILSGYSKAYDFQQEHKLAFRKDFAINEVLDDIFQTIKPKNVGVLSRAYAESVKAAQFFARIRFEEFSNVLYRDNEIKDLKCSNKALEQTNKNLTLRNNELEKIVQSRSVRAWLKLNKLIRHGR